ncbi:MAG: hypothetical protein L0241_08180 [Planctomycetia bacterium]|nr:hypothetical protein [Planctomycetia bacterium]
MRNPPQTETNQCDCVSLFVAIDINDVDVLASYATIDAASSLAGTDMGKNDLWIAAIAQVYDLTLLTTDKGFDHLHAAGIIDQTWVDPASK